MTDTEGLREAAKALADETAIEHSDCTYPPCKWCELARQVLLALRSESDSGIDVCPVFELPTPHRYDIACTACGQKGQINVSVIPRLSTPRTETSE